MSYSPQDNPGDRIFRSRAVFDEAVKQRPGRIVTLRQKTRLLPGEGDRARLIYTTLRSLIA